MKRLSPYDSLKEFSGITPGHIPGLDGMKISNPKLTCWAPQGGTVSRPVLRLGVSAITVLHSGVAVHALLIAGLSSFAWCMRSR